MRNDMLLPLSLLFMSFSLSSVGGGSSTFASMQHQAVDVHNWITSREFVELFAISRAAPGPGSMLSTLIGWKVDGWLGAAIATLSLYVPSSLLCFGVASVWERYRDRSWHAALRQGLSPVGTGLILAGALTIAKVSGAGVLSWAIALATLAILYFRPRVHPILLLTAGAAIFVLASALHAPGFP